MSDQMIASADCKRAAESKTSSMDRPLVPVRASRTVVEKKEHPMEREISEEIDSKNILNYALCHDDKKKGPQGTDEEHDSASDAVAAEHGNVIGGNIQHGDDRNDRPGVNRIDDASIQPLPTSLSANRRIEMEPGAYALSGRGRFRRPVAQLTSDSVDSTEETPSGAPSANQEDIEQPHAGVIDGAVLVGEGEEIDESHMITAQAQPELVDARTMPCHGDHEDGDPTHRRIRFIRFSVVVLLLLAAIALVIGLAGTSGGNNPNNVGVTTEMTPELVVYSPFQEDLPTDIIKGIEDTSSFHYRANAWMMNDPYLQDYSKERQTQRYGMVYLYYASHGEDWYQKTHWLSYEVSECNWFMKNSTLAVGGWKEGLEPEPTCDADGRLVVLNLTSNNLYGENFASSQGLGDKLKIIDVGYNRIYGPVPTTSARNADGLEVFLASHNNLSGIITGTVPPFKLRIYKVDGNTLFGTNDDVWQFLPNLEVFNASGNQYDNFWGGATIGLHCRNLTHFTVGHNPWRGQVPSEFGLLTKLKELDFSNSLLTGSIPSELGLLTNLEVLNLENTGVEGKVPERLCKIRENVQERGAPPPDFLFNCSRVKCCDKSHLSEHTVTEQRDPATRNV